MGKNYPGPENTYGDALERAFMLDMYMDSLGQPPGVVDSPWDPYSSGGNAMNYMGPSQTNAHRYRSYGWPGALSPEAHGEMFLNPNADQMQQAQHSKRKFPSMQMDGGAAPSTGMGMAPDTSLFHFDDLMPQSNPSMGSSMPSTNAYPGASMNRELSKPSKKRKLTPDEKKQKKLAAQAIAKERRR
jgi:hypothetical protein